MVANDNGEYPQKYITNYIEFTANEWQNFQDYLRKIAKIEIEEFAKEMRKIGIDEDTIQKRILEIKTNLISDKTLNHAKGNFGEAQSSYYLEEKEGYFVLSVGWSTNPFDGHIGIDLYGVDATKTHAVYAESKVAFVSSSYNSEMDSLVTKQMCLERLYRKSKIANNSIAAISKAYQSRLSYDERCASDDELTDPLFNNPFERIGIIIHKRKMKNNHEDNIKLLYKDEKEWKNKNPGIYQDTCVPTRIIDIKNTNLNTWFDQWLFSADVMCKIRGG